MVGYSLLSPWWLFPFLTLLVIPVPHTVGYSRSAPLGYPLLLLMVGYALLLGVDNSLMLGVDNSARVDN